MLFHNMIEEKYIWPYSTMMTKMNICVVANSQLWANLIQSW